MENTNNKITLLVSMTESSPETKQMESFVTFYDAYVGKCTGILYKKLLKLMAMVTFCANI